MQNMKGKDVIFKIKYSQKVHVSDLVDKKEKL